MPPVQLFLATAYRPLVCPAADLSCSMALKTLKSENTKWLAGLLLAGIGIVASLTVPELRSVFGLSNGSQAIPSFEGTYSWYDYDSMNDVESGHQIAGFLQDHTNEIVHISLSISMANIVWSEDGSRVESFEMIDGGFGGAILNITSDGADQIFQVKEGCCWIRFEGYFKVLGMGTTPQSMVISFSLSPVPLEAIPDRSTRAE